MSTGAAQTKEPFVRHYLCLFANHIRRTIKYWSLPIFCTIGYFGNKRPNATLLNSKELEHLVFGTAASIAKVVFSADISNNILIGKILLRGVTDKLRDDFLLLLPGKICMKR